MEGVPAEMIDQHNQQVTQAHFAEEQERARVTGNPMRGLYVNGQAAPNKRPKINESLEEIEERANKFRTDRRNGVIMPPVEVVHNPVRMLERVERETGANSTTDTANRSNTVRSTTTRRSCRVPIWRARLPTSRHPATFLARERRHTRTTRQHTWSAWRVTSSTRLRCTTARRLPSWSQRRCIECDRRSNRRGDEGSGAERREEEQEGQEPATHLLRGNDESGGENGCSASVCGFHADLRGQRLFAGKKRTMPYCKHAHW
jgi:hypothetical protein